MRINKYLSECGVCSRREADILIETNQVTVNKKPALKGMQIKEGDEVFVKGKKVSTISRKTYLAFHKPKGIVCTFEKREENNLADYLGLSFRVTYAGRLDKDSQGLLLLTDDGDFIDALMTGSNGHEKEYVVEVAGNLTDEKIRKLSEGVYLKEINRTTRPCKAWRSGANEFHIILTQGINRQIRRMCRNTQLRVMKLKRIRIENILLGELAPGSIRHLTKQELAELKNRLSGVEKSNLGNKNAKDRD